MRSTLFPSWTANGTGVKVNEGPRLAWTTTVEAMTGRIDKASRRAEPVALVYTICLPRVQYLLRTRPGSGD